MNTPLLKAAAVLLAAGLSRRMGERNKLLIEIDGEPLVRRTAKVYLEAGVHIHAVLGYQAEQVRKALQDLPVVFVENPSFEEGQQSSVRAGVESLGSGFGAVMIALADQAALKSTDISELLQAFGKTSGERVLIPYYGERRGNPVVFPAKLIADMRAAGLNAACRNFIDQNPHLTLRYEAANDHFATDIDTPEDLAVFQSRLQSSPL